MKYNTALLVMDMQLAITAGYSNSAATIDKISRQLATPEKQESR